LLWDTFILDNRQAPCDNIACSAVGMDGRQKIVFEKQVLRDARLL